MNKEKKASIAGGHLDKNEKRVNLCHEEGSFR